MHLHRARGSLEDSLTRLAENARRDSVISLFAALHAALYAIRTVSKPVDFQLRSSLRLVCFAGTASVDSQRLSGFPSLRAVAERDQLI